MKYKLFVVDIDGTLLNFWKHLSKENNRLVNEYISKGGNVVLCTGRSFSTAKKYVEKIEKFCNNKLKYIICSKGGVIYNFLSSSSLKFKIPHETVKKLLDYCNQHKINLWAYTDASNKKDGVFVNKKTFSVTAKIFINLNLYAFPKDDTDISAYKLNVFAFKKKMQEFNKWVSKEFNNLDITKHSYLQEITLKGANKGTAVDIIAKEMGVTKDEIACIGDSANDIEMFNSCGLKIAVNHSAKLTKKADVVYHSQKNAVAKAIQKYLLK